MIKDATIKCISAAVVLFTNLIWQAAVKQQAGRTVAGNGRFIDLLFQYTTSPGPCQAGLLIGCNRRNMAMASITKTAIVKGTLGRRIYLERFRLNGMKKEGKVESLSYQYGLLAGLEIARQIFETDEHDDSH